MIVNKYANGGGGSTSGVTPQQVQAQIDSALTPYWESGETKDYVDEAISGISLEGYATSGDMQSAFTLISETQQVAAAGLNQLEGRIDELSAATPSVDLSGYYTSAQTEEAITSKNYVTSGQVKSQVEAYDYATVSQLPVVPTSNTAFTNDAGYLVSSDVEDFVTSGDVKTQIEAYHYISGVDLSDYWTAAETQEAINQAALSGQVDMSAYYTSAQTDAAIAQAVSGLATEQYVQDALSGVNMDNYYTSAQTEEAISAATSGKADAANVTPKTGRYFPEWNAQGIITGSSQMAWLTNDIVNGKVRKQTLSNDSSNGFAIYAPESAGTAGDILVSAGANQAPVWSAVTFPDVSNYVTSAQVETQIEAKNYVNSGDVKSQVEAYNYATVSQIPTVPTSNTAFTNDAGYITDAAIENLVTSAQVETQIDTKAAAYTPTSGFSTINGSAITNGGDIVIEGGADMSAYWTSAQTENAIISKNYVTSAQVETQIVEKNYITSADTANLVTSAQVETQITSKGYATVSQIPTVPTSNTAFTNDAGYITSAAIANMVTSTSVSTIWRGTQSDYDAIPTKDPNTFYIIL